MLTACFLWLGPLLESVSNANNMAAALQEPEYTVYTDRVSTCSDYVWYTGENLNANSALHVGPSAPYLTVPATRQSRPA